MRDALIERLYDRMRNNDKIFFVSADLGAPALDKLRKDFKDRFLNVGIAEQNLINICTGLSLEGFIVYAYAIAGFLTMRAYEQIRTNLALMSQQRAMNVNLIGVGAGVSYDMSGPSHHCLEDISIMRTLPNIVLCSPSDWLVAEEFVDFSIAVNKPKYIRLDGKALPRIYEKHVNLDWGKGFCELVQGKRICVVSSGYTTHIAIKIAKEVDRNGDVGILDIFLLKPVDEDALFNVLKKYRCIITVEESFVGKGGLDCLVSNLFSRRNAPITTRNLGFADKYVFESGSREYLYELHHLGEKDLSKMISQALQDNPN
jgi:transketolase